MQLINIRDENDLNLTVIGIGDIQTLLKTVTKYLRNAIVLAVDVYAYQMSPLIETTV